MSGTLGKRSSRKLLQPELLHFCARVQDEPEEIVQPFVRNPEVDVSHGSRLWPCGSCRRRGEIVGAGSLGMTLFSASKLAWSEPLDEPVGPFLLALWFGAGGFGTPLPVCPDGTEDGE